jgi:hypothetical protein
MMGFEIFCRPGVPARDRLKIGGISTDKPFLIETGRWWSGFSTGMAFLIYHNFLGLVG